jgi:hypothetical protein
MNLRATTLKNTERSDGLTASCHVYLCLLNAGPPVIPVKVDFTLRPRVLSEASLPLSA